MNYINQQFVKLLIFIVVLSCSNVIHAHSKGYSTDTAKLKNIQISELEDTILSFAEKMPEFPGGRDSLKNFIVSHFQLPEEAIKNGIFGKVFVQFIVNKQGKVLNPKVLKGIGGGCDEEALRVVQNFPDWTPGQENGKVVSVYYTIPIIFQKPVEEPLTFIEKMPQFLGGGNAMVEFIYSKMVYPKEAKQKGICGRVLVQFIVKADGKIEGTKILCGVDSSLDMEALRLVNSFSNWIPGVMDGKPVPVYRTVPIMFEQKTCKSFKYNFDPISDNSSNQYLIGYDYKLPEFPGGNDSLNQFLLRNMKYPKDAEEKGIGGTVYLKMDVSKEGKIINPKVIQGVYSSIDSEALRVIKLFPPFISARRKDIPMELSNYSLEFTFNPENKFVNDSLVKLSNIDKEEPLTFVEEMPEFPGGMDAMMRFLWGNIRYPKTALELGIMGKVVLQYIVDKNGEILNVKVIRSLGGGCDEEAIRVVKSMPKWKPGRQNGKIVPVYFTLPIFFQLKE